MKGIMQKISKDTYQQKDRAELEGYAGRQTFIWITENNITNAGQPIIIVWLSCKLRNRRVPNGTHGGVEGRNGI